MKSRGDLSIILAYNKAAAIIVRVGNIISKEVLFCTYQAHNLETTQMIHARTRSKWTRRHLRLVFLKHLSVLKLYHISRDGLTGIHGDDMEDWDPSLQKSKGPKVLINGILFS